MATACTAQTARHWAKPPSAPLAFTLMGHAGELLVASAVGRPGAEFRVSKKSHLQVTEALQKDLKIAEQGKQSGVLRASLEDDDPELASRILNEIGQLYVRQNVQRKAAEAEKSIAFLNTQLPDLKKQLEASEGKFNQFRSTQGTFDLEPGGRNLPQASGRPQGQAARSGTKAQGARHPLHRPAPQHAGAGWPDRRAAAADRRARRPGQEVPGGRAGPAARRATSRSATSSTPTCSTASSNYAWSRKAKVGNVRIVDTAAVPERLVKRSAAWCWRSGVLGLLAGLGLGFLRNSLRSGIKSAEQIEQELGLNVFATVPKSALQALAQRRRQGQEARHPPAGHRQPDDAAIESLRSLTIRSKFAMLDAANRIVLISGPNAGHRQVLHQRQLRGGGGRRRPARAADGRRPAQGSYPRILPGWSAARA